MFAFARICAFFVGPAVLMFAADFFVRNANHFLGPRIEGVGVLPNPYLMWAALLLCCGVGLAIMSFGLKRMKRIREADRAASISDAPVRDSHLAAVKDPDFKPRRTESRFGWFNNQKHLHRREEDALWLSDAARLQGVVAESRRLNQGGMRVMIGAQSPATVQVLQDACSGQAAEVFEFRELKPAKIAQNAHGAKSLTLFLIGATADPDGEENLLVACRTLPFTIRLQVHHSLADPLLADLASPRMLELLRQPGIEAHEPIVDKRVSGAIAKARRKVTTRTA